MRFGTINSYDTYDQFLITFLIIKRDQLNNLFIYLLTLIRRILHSSMLE